MINDEKILNQIERELNRAKQTDNRETRRTHMRAIASLTELVLEDDETEATNKTTPTAQATDAETLELQKMMGDTYQPSKSQEVSQSKAAEDRYGQGSGSLLDF